MFFESILCSFSGGNYCVTPVQASLVVNYHQELLVSIGYSLFYIHVGVIAFRQMVAWLFFFVLITHLTFQKRGIWDKAFTIFQPTLYLHVTKQSVINHGPPLPTSTLKSLRRDNTLFFSSCKISRRKRKLLTGKKEWKESVNPPRKRQLPTCIYRSNNKKFKEFKFWFLLYILFNIQDSFSLIYCNVE